MQFFGKTNIDFLGVRKIFVTTSLIVVSGCFILALILGPRLGIDFAGGTEVAVQFKDAQGNETNEQLVRADDLRKVINDAGLLGSEIKSFGGANQYLIRVLDTETGDAIIIQALNSSFSQYTIEILKVDRIGPKIGSELYMEALLAVLAAVVCILLYIAFRFEFVFGLGAIVGLLHDVLLTFGLIVIVHHLGLINLEVNQGILAAMLTVVGYSINNTVIVFDRIRENKEQHKGMNVIKMMNMSINDTLSRTINTTGTTVIVFITIMLFGGPVLQGLAFTMFIGILTGTYSSILIANSFVIWYYQKVRKLDLSEGLAKAESNATKLKGSKA